MKLSLLVLFVCLIFTAINAQTAAAPKATAPAVSFILEDAPAFKQLQTTVTKSNADVQTSVKALTNKVADLVALIEKLQQKNVELASALKASKEDSSKFASSVKAQIADMKATVGSSPVFEQFNKVVGVVSKKATEATTVIKSAVVPVLIKAQPFVNKATIEVSKIVDIVVANVNAQLPVARGFFTKLAAQANIPAESVPFAVTTVLAVAVLAATSFALLIIQAILSLLCCCGGKKKKAL